MNHRCVFSQTTEFRCSKSAHPIRSQLPRHVLDKVHRWSMYFSQLHFAIEHISRTDRLFGHANALEPKHRLQEAAMKNRAALYWSRIPNTEEKPMMHICGLGKFQRKHPLGKAVKTDAEGIGKFEGKTWVALEERMEILKYWYMLFVEFEDIVDMEARKVGSGHPFCGVLWKRIS